MEDSWSSEIFLLGHGPDTTSYNLGSAHATSSGCHGTVHGTRDLGRVFFDGIPCDGGAGIQQISRLPDPGDSGRAEIHVGSNDNASRS
jgi:hypothetical protein